MDKNTIINNRFFNSSLKSFFNDNQFNSQQIYCDIDSLSQFSFDLTSNDEALQQLILEIDTVNINVTPKRKIRRLSQLISPPGDAAATKSVSFVNGNEGLRMRRSSMDLAAKGLTSRFSGKQSAGGKLQKQRRKSVAATALQHIRRASFSAQKESIFTDSSNDSSRLETTENSRTSYLSVLSQNDMETERSDSTYGEHDVLKKPKILGESLLSGEVFE